MAENYETALLLAPTLSDEEVQSHIDIFSNHITSRGGEVVHVQKWGRRHLEYQIAGHSEAIYMFLYFRIDGAGSLVEEFERLVRITESLLREMTVKVAELKIVEPPSGSSRFSAESRLAQAGGRRGGGARFGRREGGREGGRPGSSDRFTGADKEEEEPVSGEAPSTESVEAPSTESVEAPSTPDVETPSTQDAESLPTPQTTEE
ncbi:30S ribosomal protein S6 [bacterium]|nr:30S ribosomal protein S6 [bacterium]